MIAKSPILSLAKQDIKMAAGHSDYDRGSMEITGQKGTFSGFMGGTVYGGSAIALVVIMPTLIFAVGMGWLWALITTFIIGLLLGLGLKLKSGWYVGLIGASIVAAIFCFIMSLFF